MSTFGLQNEAFLRLKSVPKSTQKSDLEKRGFWQQGRARMVEDGRGWSRTVEGPRISGRVVGGGGRRKSTEIFRI